MKVHIQSWSQESKSVWLLKKEHTHNQVMNFLTLWRKLKSMNIWQKAQRKVPNELMRKGQLSNEQLVRLQMETQILSILLQTQLWQLSLSKKNLLKSKKHMSSQHISE